MRLVCFPFTSAASSGLGLSGRVDGVVFVEEELAGGCCGVVDESCAIAGIARATVKSITITDGHSGGIQLSRGKFNTPEIVKDLPAIGWLLSTDSLTFREVVGC